MKKILLAAVVGLGLLAATVAQAAPGDWRVMYRNTDDSADVPLAIQTAPATSTARVLGGRIGDNGGSWYNFSNMFSINPATGPYGANNYTISLDLGTWSVLDSADGFDLLAGKASTSSVNTLASTIADLSAFNLTSFMLNQASTSLLDATTTYNGFMSSSDKIKLNALSTSTVSQAYEGTTQRLNAFPIFKSATISSGVAVFNLTTDGTSGGAALCTNGVIQDSVNVTFNDSTSSYQQSWAFSNANKTLTVTANKFTTANILSGILGQAAANSSVAKLTVWCY